MPQPRLMIAALTAAALALGACGDQEAVVRPIEAPNEGVQLSGRVGGAQLSVSFGDPDFLLADCDAEDGLDADWCLVARSIDGARIELIIENPAIFIPGAVLDVDFDRCLACDEIDTGAIVDLVVGGVRKRAIDGTVRVTEAGPRYAMAFTLRFDDGGTITGDCNVRPRGALVPAEGEGTSEGQ